MNETLRFLHAVWPTGVPGGQRLLLWTLPERLSYWASDIDEAAKIALRLAPTHDVYLGVGAGRMPEHEPERHRLSTAEILTLPGFVADFDLDGPGHKKERLFKSDDEILDFVGGLPLQPTALVHSGGGIHGWWLFKEPWQLESDSERSRARALSRGWTYFLRAEAEKRDRQIDAVWDLARILRIPGTWNHKHETPRPVRWLEQGR